MRTLALTAALSLAIGTAIGQPLPNVLSDEQPVADPGIGLEAVGGHCAIASNGNGFVLITAVDHFFQGFQYVVHGLDANGHPLPGPSARFTGIGDVPGIASNGKTYFAVWGGLGATWGVTLDESGNAPGPAALLHGETRFQHSSHDTAGTRPIAWNGNAYVIGSVLDYDNRGAIPIVTGVNPPFPLVPVCIATRDGVTVVVGSSLANDKTGEIATVTADGAIASVVTVPSATFVDNEAVAAGTDGFLVVWAARDGIGTLHLDPSGKVDGAASKIPVIAYWVSVASAGESRYRIACSTISYPPTATTMLVDARGSLLDTPVVAPGFEPTVGFDGTKNVIAWTPGNLHPVLRVKRAEDPGEGEPVFLQPCWQQARDIAFEGKDTLVMWNDIASASLAGRYQSVQGASAEARADDTDFFIGHGMPDVLAVTRTIDGYTARWPNRATAPFVVPATNPKWTGSALLFVWTPSLVYPSTPVSLQRFAADGSRLDVVPRPIGSIQPGQTLFTATASAGANTLLLYGGMGGGINALMLFGDVFLPLSGIAPSSMLTSRAAAATDGSNFLAVWPNGSSSLVARVIPGSGAITGDPKTIAAFVGNIDSVGAFWIGTNYLVVWTEGPADSLRLWAELLDASGVPVRAPSMIATVSGSGAQWDYKDGLLALAYTRSGRVFTRFAYHRRGPAVRH